MICCLCVDADWAHPEVTVFTLNLLEGAGIPFTFMATEDQFPPQSHLVEVAWHPNFERGLPREELHRLQARFPGARGVRPHRLAWGDCETDLLRDFGLTWTSSRYKPDEYTPFNCGSLTEIPISWGDNWWFLKRLLPDFEAMRRNAPGIYVLNMHPVHVYLNTVSLEQYEKAKMCYRSPKVLRSLRNNTDKGVADVLKDILNEAGAYPDRFLTLSDALEHYATQGKHILPPEYPAPANSLS